MTAAFLVRCSTDKQDFDRQLSDLNKVAEGFGYEVSTKYIFGEYVTGKDDTTKGDRKSIRKLREAAERNEFDAILVSEVSRMSRDSVSGRVYVRQFNNIGIPVYFRDKKKWTIDRATNKVDEDFEKELGHFFDGAAEYLKSMKTQTASGRRKRLEDNQLIQGKPAYGYMKQGGNVKRSKSTIVVNPETSPIVVETYMKYLEEGSTLKSTALAISAKTGEKFSVGKIFHILNYTGYYTGQTLVNVKDPDNKDADPESFVITFDPILEESLYTEAQTKLRGNRASTKPHNAKQRVHLLSRLIKCSFCGHSYTPRMRNDKRTAYNWLCMSGINNVSDCHSNINLNGEKMDSLIWNFIKKELLSYSELNNEEKRTRVDSEKELIERYEEEVQELLNAKEGFKKTQNRAYQAYISAPDGAEEVALERYNSTLIETKKEIEYLDGRITLLNQYVKDSNIKISRYLETDFTESYINDIESSFDKKRNMFTEYIKAIYPYKVAYRILVLEVHTIDGIFNILLDGNQRNHKEAYYINSIYAVWQNSNNRSTAYDAGDHFLVKLPNMVMDSEEMEEFLSFSEMIEVCKANEWTLDYHQEPTIYKN